jgi:glycosyltransferase involved in cell wall biosynthesis
MNRPLKVAFLLDSFIIAGGIAAILEHCGQLENLHFEPYIITDDNVRSDRRWHPNGPALRVFSFDEAKRIDFDVAIATWWKTAYRLHQLRAKNYAYFVQSIESRFYSPTKEAFLKPLVTATYHLPLTFITEARWIQEYLQKMRPGASVFYVRNGIDKTMFNLGERTELEPNPTQPLRILVEGPLGVWFKETMKAIQIASELPFPKRITLVTASDVPAGVRRFVNSVYTKVPLNQMPQIYRETDVLLKLSKVEGMFMPPLEAFHCGATAICCWVTGCDEYLRHGWNGFIAAPGDYDSIRRYLILIDKDRRLLNFLRYNALSTAKSWPSWNQASRFMASVLAKIAEKEGPADPYAPLLIPSLFGLEAKSDGSASPGGNLGAVLSSGSYRLAQKISKFRHSWPMVALRRIVPDKIKRPLKHWLIN